VEHVVVQVVTDRQVGEHVDAVVLEVLGVPDAGKHEQLRGSDEPGGEDDLLAGAHRALGAVGVDDLDPGGPAVFDHDSLRQHLGLQLECG